ncbi:MAG: hypothetical protein ACO4AM_07780 [Candidatus Nanopelagicaceae bacterium]
MTNTSANLFGGGGEETDWRGIPIEKEPEGPTQEQIEAQIKQEITRLEEQIKALKSSLVDNEGAD